MIIYNTLTKSLEEFKPLHEGDVGLYTCGPTVYNFAHIGNLRTYVFEDILKRVLEYNGYRVRHVMNITDVGHLTSDGDEGADKMEKGAAREGKTAYEIAAFYTDAFKKDLESLHVQPPTVWCKATDHIPEQIDLIKKLEKKGYTYGTHDGVYFDTSKLPDYGKLANMSNQHLLAGARVAVGQKKHPTDFALWKFSPTDSQRQMEWESPWGKGFPGWHIECSAMSTKYLGQPFDIHTGGIDHVPVHHTNEIAQSEAAAGGTPLAKIWMHGEFLLMGDDKMAKSGDNFITLQTLIEKNLSPIAYRYFLLQTHYRKPLTFSYEAVTAAKNGLQHLYSLAQELDRTHGETRRVGKDLHEQFLAAVNDDLNIPHALALVWDAVKNKSVSQEELIDIDRVLGLGINEELARALAPAPRDITALVQKRDEARAKKDWLASDALRAELEAAGYRVDDTPTGTKIVKVS